MLTTKKKYNFFYNIKFIYSDFLKVAKKLETSFDYYWWFLNSSRLDIRPAGEIELRKKVAKPRSNFNLLIDFFLNNILILKNIFFKIFIFKKKKKLDNKTILIVEKINFSTKASILDYYYKNLFINNDFSIITIGFNKGSSEEKDLSLFDICGLRKIVKCYFKCIAIYIKFMLFIYQIEKMKLNYTNFWKEFFIIKEKENGFKNFFLSNLIGYIDKEYLNTDSNYIYPYEEKPYERSLNYHFKKNNCNRLYAYYGNPQDHQALFLRKFTRYNIPRSKNYLFAGKEQLTQLNSYFRFKDSNKLNIIGSDKSIKQYSKNIKYDFLVLIAHENELETFVSWISSQESDFQNFNFLIRYYNAIDNRNLVKKIKTIKKNLNFSFSENNLNKDIENSAFSIFSRTSAGVQCINAGMLSIWSDLSLVGANPLFNKIENFFPSFSSKELAMNLKKIKLLTKDQINNQLTIQRQVTKNIYSKIDYEMIDRILQ